jgi:hypothetical protein
VNSDAILRMSIWLKYLLDVIEDTSDAEIAQLRRLHTVPNFLEDYRNLCVKLKVKLSLSTPWRHIAGIGGIVPLILNLDTRRM